MAMDTTDYMTMTANDLPEYDSPSPRDETEPQAERRPSRTERAAGRRQSVATACERCRRRKVKCSGLPGPCTVCLKFSVRCVDPGQRRVRSQSILEDRIKRLEALAAAGLPIDASNLDGTIFPGQETATKRAFLELLPLESPNFATEMRLPPDHPYYAAANDPWTGSHHMHSPTASHMHSPTASHMQSPTEMPSAQFMSHDSSRSTSRSSHPMDRTAFNMPLRVPFTDQQGFTFDPEWGAMMPRSAPPGDMSDAYSDSYVDFMPPLERSVTLPQQTPTPPAAGPTSSPAPMPSIVTTSHPYKRPRRRNTTCFIPRSSPSPLLSPETSWMLDSPRTTNYLRRYFTDIHPQYPFLDQSKFFPSTTSRPFDVLPSDDPRSTLCRDYIATVQRLLVAAIGGMLHHQSRDISARYVRCAMALQEDNKMKLWSSLSGIHCALLLATYCYLETVLAPFANEDAADDVSHTDLEPNLWLFNCRIANSCTDIGLQFSSGDGMEEGGSDGGGAEDSSAREMYRSTFQSAYVLDRQISQLMRRPRAIRDEDLGLILGDDMS